MPKIKDKSKKTPFVGYCKHCYMMLGQMDLMKPGFKCPACNKYTARGELRTSHPKALSN